MAVYILSNLLSGNTGLDKSIVMTANHLHRAGYPTSVINFIGPGDGTKHLTPRWPLDLGIPLHALQTLPADGGRLLHRNVHPVFAGRIPNLNYSFTENGLAALGQLNRELSSTDTIIFTHPLQAQAFRMAVGSDDRRVRTVMQIHGDYKVRHPELGPMLIESRSVVDEIQIVSKGMEPDYVDDFGAEHVHWIPNIHEPSRIERVDHDGVNVVLVGSFQDAKNQLDAVRMLQRIPSPEVRLTLWGNNATKYGAQVLRYVERSGLADRVHLPGIGSESDIYGSADIVIVPSRSEGFGYALVEAASHGLPVVAYDYDYGPRDVIQSGETGYIVPEGDIEALGARVAELARDADARWSMGEAARRAYQEVFSPDRVVTMYDALLSGSVAPGPVLTELFRVDGGDPFEASSIRTHPLRVKGRSLIHLIEVKSDRRLRRFEIDSGNAVKRARAVRLGRRYFVPMFRGNPGRGFYRAARRVLSCETADSSLGRFYVGNTTLAGRFEVAQYLLRTPKVKLSDGRGAAFSVAVNQLEVARHPRHPVVSAVDDMGVAANANGGVSVTNGGNVVHPFISIAGEFDAVEFFDGISRRSFSPPFGYAEMFDRFCQAEREHGLFDHVTSDGIHPWELYRAALIASLSEAMGFWGAHFSSSALPTWDVFYGDKQLATAGNYERVLFEFPRKPDSVDPRTAAFHAPDAMIIEYPQPFGYTSAVYTEPNRFPIGEFNRWRKQAKLPLDTSIDSSPFERALSDALGFPVSLGDQLARRVRKFVEERDFWSAVFRRVEPQEVIIPSSYWSAGICQAARSVGAQVSDIQYALTSRYHPSYWLGGMPHHGASTLYAWSPFWAERTNVYNRHEIVARPPSGVADADGDRRWDVCVVSQPRVFRRFMRFVEQFVAERPDLRLCIAPHPDERADFEDKLVGFGRKGQVEIAPGSTLSAIRSSSICVGGYSTSLYEAAALGIPVFVLPVPGHEIVGADIDSGLFRKFTTFDELEPYDVPSWASSLFGAAV